MCRYFAPHVSHCYVHRGVNNKKILISRTRPFRTWIIVYTCVNNRFDRNPRQVSGLITCAPQSIHNTDTRYTHIGTNIYSITCVHVCSCCLLPRIVNRTSLLRSLMHTFRDLCCCIARFVAMITTPQVAFDALFNIPVLDKYLHSANLYPFLLLHVPRARETCKIPSIQEKCIYLKKKS